jgi:hypothetical protein
VSISDTLIRVTAPITQVLTGLQTRREPIAMVTEGQINTIEMGEAVFSMHLTNHHAVKMYGGVEV